MRPASMKIHPPQYFQILKKKNGRITNIIDDIEAAIREGVSMQLTEFSKDFQPTVNGLNHLWYWVKKNIQYEEDGEEAQIVQEPARLNTSRKGDCKSFTLFVVSVLICLRIPFTIQYVHYSDTDSNHVYPIAHLPGGDVIVDAVWTRFNEQKEPYRLIRWQLYKL